MYRTREEVASLLSFPKPENIVFTENATYALNLAIKTTVPHGAHVIVSDMEHNSVMRPLEKLRRTDGVRISVFRTDGNLAENMESVLRDDTSVIVSTLCGNVSGERVPLDVLSEIRGRHPGIRLIVDASQAIGHEEINLRKTPCDILCAPGHKGLFGIQGCGFAVFCDEKVRDSFIEGGSGSDSESPEMPDYLPDRYEAGTLPTPAIVTLGSGIRYLKKIGMKEIRERLSSYSERLYDRLTSIAGIRPLARSDSGVISFTYGDCPSSKIADALDRRGICTRSGLHCAPAAHRKFGTTETGAVRASLSVMNTEREIDGFADALCDIIAGGI
ncbi:MAG TPA: cysteine desulfurase [Clostridiales bacterium]|nr:cysteine desulfurase [Clostridiales bacterium]